MGTEKLNNRPVIIGSGPAGLFASLVLAQRGFNPIMIERGLDVDNRTNDINNFWNERKFKNNSNVQFGEGGAGTFSDGKLNTLTKDKENRGKKVFDIFVENGAPEEIKYIHNPHIGTDILRDVVKNIRNKIIDMGGEFRYNSCLTNIFVSDDKIRSIEINNSEIMDADILVLAIGHSARDTFEMLYNNGLYMESKPFAMGIRIQHSQEMINISQYGNNYYKGLGPANYKLTYKSTEGRGVYSFCMCPGGYVMASSSEENSIVTNGMSEFKRDGENANSALLVNVLTTDLGDSPLSGIDFQERLEKDAFVLGGSNYNAPIQRVEDFLNNRKSTFVGEVKPTYLPGVTLSNLNDILPEFVSKTLKEGIIYFDKKIKGFASGDAILTGVETRSSSPVRINRNEDFVSSILGLYPCGEGPGYAGGIMSAAVDGIKCAIKILEKDK